MSYAPGPPSDDGIVPPPQLEIVIPVYNEAQQLAASVTALRTFLDARFPLTTVVTVVDNASTDDTWTIASGLAASLPGVHVLWPVSSGATSGRRASSPVARSHVHVGHHRRAAGRPGGPQRPPAALLVEMQRVDAAAGWRPARRRWSTCRRCWRCRPRSRRCSTGKDRSRKDRSVVMLAASCCASL